MVAAHVNQGVQKHRDALCMARLRPVQIEAPDTRRPDFAEERRRQCLLVAQAVQGDFGKPRAALVVQADPFSEHGSLTVHDGSGHTLT